MTLYIKFKDDGKLFGLVRSKLQLKLSWKDIIETHVYQELGYMNWPKYIGDTQCIWEYTCDMHNTLIQLPNLFLTYLKPNYLISVLNELKFGTKAPINS